MELTKERYFGLNIGNKVFIDTPDIKTVGILKSVDLTDKYSSCYVIPIQDEELNEEESSNFLIDTLQLILRPISDMNDDESYNLWKLATNEFRSKTTNMEFSDINKLYTSFTVEQFQYLISIGIDIFNLKEKGIAIYESDLKGENNG